ncbi:MULTISPECIES: phosphotransferase enzyme family protein [Fischerella]|uniref:Aminoglycoside phosphotransferase n=1 Tax=Fischerella muscicola CCMEE 5323 TaxID=2019572 RepID=A0A2N6K588_FISMU|nr:MULTISPECIES: aminoglycoside phosphotransferase family protein [Fischerella]MBD2430120.1 aminoglycoside phosphotransferase family protein [Fischerella sp. FACHB-380]PLZ91576.1 aminoglycoside phosphotransferase [Fischerella muscicola CCMEE 5323]
MSKYLKTQNTDNLVNIADQFTLQRKVTTVQSFGSGNINDTFLVTLDSPDEKHFILQRINTQVFRQPQLIMQNMCTFTEHVRNRLQLHPLNRRWEVPRVLLTKDGQDYCRDTEGSFWRAISFIADSQSFDTMQNTEQAKEIGYALGMFHNLISDLPPERLADTLEGFHITPLYLQQYNEVLAKTSPCQSPEVNYCLQFVSDRQNFAHVLENAKATGKLPLRLMHGDPKINNVMFDTSTNQAVSVIDLDTVKPGLIHYDIGDCLRSGCNPAGEETEEWESVYFDTELCQGILQGYLSVAKEFLTENDYTYIYDAIRLIAFELGLRFFADYLAGNVYFKVKYPEHNLARALVQFKLTESIESQEASIRKIIRDMK